MNNLGMEIIPTGQWTNTQADWVVKVQRALGIVAPEARLGTYPAFYYTDPAIHNMTQTTYRCEIDRILAVLDTVELSSPSSVAMAKRRLAQLIPMVTATADVIYTVPIGGLFGVPAKYLSKCSSVDVKGDCSTKLDVKGITMVRTEEVLPEILENAFLAAVLRYWAYIYDERAQLTTVLTHLEQLHTYGGDSFLTDVQRETAQTVLAGNLMLEWLNDADFKQKGTIGYVSRLGAKKRMEIKNWLIVAGKLSKIIRTGMKPIELTTMDCNWSAINDMAKAVDGLFDTMEMIDMMTELLIQNGESTAAAELLHFEGAAGRARWQATAETRFYVQEYRDIQVKFHGITLTGRMPAAHTDARNDLSSLADVYTTAPVDGTMKHLAMEYYPDDMTTQKFKEQLRAIKSSSAMNIVVGDVHKPIAAGNMFGAGVGDFKSLFVNGGVINQVIELSKIDSLHNVNFAPSVKDRISSGEVIVRRNDIDQYDTDFVRDSGTRYFPLLVR